MTDVYDGIALSCRHLFCNDCVECYLKMGSPSNLLTFNHLYCPFKCGSSFVDSAVMGVNILRDLIVKEIQLMERASRLTQNILRKDEEYNNLMTKGKSSSYTQTDYNFDKVPIFRCTSDGCDEIFIGTHLSCGASGEILNNNPNELCLSCKNTRKCAANINKLNSQQKIKSVSTFWSGQINRSNQKQEDEDTMAVCDTDSNAILQQGELEVMQSIYPEEVTILVPAPEKAGDYCASFFVRMPLLPTIMSIDNRNGSSRSRSGKVVDEVVIDFGLTRIEKSIRRVSSEVLLVFQMSTGYPETTPLVVKLKIGNLSMLEFDTNMRRSLLEKLISTSN